MGECVDGGLVSGLAGELVVKSVGRRVDGWEDGWAHVMKSVGERVNRWEDGWTHGRVVEHGCSRGVVGTWTGCVCGVVCEWWCGWVWKCVFCGQVH